MRKLPKTESIMLTFHSGQAKTNDIQVGVAKCMRDAFPDNNYAACGLVIVQTTMFENFLGIVDAIRRYAPQALVVGNSCDGIVGREGPGDSMEELTILAVTGPATEFTIKAVSGIYQYNSHRKALDLAWELRAAEPEVTVALLLCQGKNLSHDGMADAFSEAFGDRLALIGGTVSGPTCCFVDLGPDCVMIGEHMAWVVGFSDPTLQCKSRWIHNAAPYGDPLIVSDSEQNRVFKFNGRPAWQELTSRLQDDTIFNARDPITVLAAQLPKPQYDESDQGHILCAITSVDTDDSLSLPVECPIGMQLWPVKLRFNSFFPELFETLATLGHREPLAVFQLDSLLPTGGTVKNSAGMAITASLQNMFESDGKLPPWMGMKCLGAYARAGDVNCFHTHSICVAVLYRQIRGHVARRRLNRKSDQVSSQTDSEY